MHGAGLARPRWLLIALLLLLAAAYALGTLPAGLTPPASGIGAAGSPAIYFPLMMNGYAGSVLPQPPCQVSGSLAADATWSPASCSSYLVTGSVVVPPGVRLTVEPGTTVRFDSLAALLVQGTLVARGTPSSPITFTSSKALPSAGDWGYVYFADSSADATFDADGTYTGGSIVQHAIVEYAGGAGGAALSAENAFPHVDHDTIRNNKGAGVSVGIYSYPGDAVLRITNNVVSGNGGGGIDVYRVDSGPTTVGGNAVTGNRAASGAGIYVYRSRPGPTTITGNTIAGNESAKEGGGIYVDDDWAAVGANVIADNAAAFGGGVYVHSSSPLVSGNTITGNVASSGGGIYVEAGSPIVGGNVVAGNRAYSGSAGGGIYVAEGASPVIGDNDLRDNLANVPRPTATATATRTPPPGGPTWTPTRTPRPTSAPGPTSTPTPTPVIPVANELSNGRAPGGANLDARDNYWGVADAAAIEQRIWHFFDDPSLGLVDFTPFRTQSIGSPRTATPGPTSTPTVRPTSTPTRTPTVTPTSTVTPTATPAASCPTIGGTVVGGTVDRDTVWTRALSPYCAGDSVLVASGATLTVEPGVTVRFDPGKGLRVDGALVARGTAAEPITFTSSQSIPARGDWANIHFTDSSVDAAFDGSGSYVGGSIVQYAVVEYGGGSGDPASGALLVEAASPYVDHATIRNNRASGIFIQSGGSPRVTSNTIVGNTSAYCGGGIHVYADYGRSASIGDNSIGGNAAASGGGICAYVGSGSALTIAGNEVSGNAATDGGGGLYVYPVYGTASVSIGRNTITNNVAGQTDSGGGVLLHGFPLTIAGNNLYGNVAGNPGSPNDVRSGAAHVDAENNYWGTTDSSAIAAHIYDYFDDTSLGAVDYEPYLAAPVDIRVTPTPTPTVTPTPTWWPGV